MLWGVRGGYWGVIGEVMVMGRSCVVGRSCCKVIMVIGEVIVVGESLYLIGCVELCWGSCDGKGYWY